MTTLLFPALDSRNTSIALRGASGDWTYADLQRQVLRVAAALLGTARDLGEERIAFLLPASADYIAVLLGLWRAGGIAVPLNVSAALPELEHALHSAGVTRLLLSRNTEPALATALGALCEALGIRLLRVEDLGTGAESATRAALPDLSPSRRALILFTSGTTNKPKGVVSTHHNIATQITTLLAAWHWQQQDRIPLFLPLHHIHGIINILCCALWQGAELTLFPRFELEPLLQQVAERHYTLFMAVPTIYVKLVQALEALPPARRSAVSAGFAAMRLNVSGSAACPVKLFQQWQQLTGQTLLERYGMTEIGMALSNPYHGERRAGMVGLPLPGVEVALFDDADQRLTAEDQPGEIRIRGATVFLEYWNNPAATAASFRDGWFCTGDVAVREQGYFRILGRSSIDIIKSGGYKLSALEIEGALLTHDKIAECAVVGVEDETWGEAVTACVVLRPGEQLTLAELKTWCEGRLSPYKIPKQLRLFTALPRNAMGKVVKAALKQPVAGQPSRPSA
jgi:malonyl-CoA/methylmalonyl-CoA synthetase